jgi:hypothetical protein
MFTQVENNWNFEYKTLEYVKTMAKYNFSRKKVT